jgi:hypothetical protein
MDLIVTTLISFGVFALVIGGMAIGVIAGRQPIKGSCGGVNGKGCELCSGSGRCKKKAQ